MIETINKIVRTSRQMLNEIGREPTPEELAEKLGMPLEKVRKVLKIAKEPLSLETPIGDEEDSHLGDFIEDKNAILPIDAAIQSNLRETTTRVLASLTPREERVLRMRFGIGMNTDHTLEEVGQQFSVTRERIRQIEAKALRKLKHPSRSAEAAELLGQLGPLNRPALIADYRDSGCPGPRPTRAGIALRSATEYFAVCFAVPGVRRYARIKPLDENIKLCNHCGGRTTRICSEMARANEGDNSVDAILQSVGGRRFTQDLPIMPDVWAAYRQQPGEPQDLLLTPHGEARAGQLAQELRRVLDVVRDKRPGSGPASVAHMPGIVAAKLYFDELIGVVLPRTPWWRKRTASAAATLREEGERAAQRPDQDAHLFPLSPKEIERIAKGIDELANTASGMGSIMERGKVPSDFLYVVALSGHILTKEHAGRTEQNSEFAGRTLDWVKAFASVCEGPVQIATHRKKAGEFVRSGFATQLLLARFAQPPHRNVNHQIHPCGKGRCSPPPVQRFLQRGHVGGNGQRHRQGPPGVRGLGGTATSGRDAPYPRHSHLRFHQGQRISGSRQNGPPVLGGESVGRRQEIQAAVGA